MPVGAEVYRAVDESDELSSGDIVFLSLARTRLVGERTPPGDSFDPVGRVAAYPRPGLLPLHHDREVAIDTMFALVITHSCEIDRQKNMAAADHFDCRLTVAPIVPEPAVKLTEPDGMEQAVNWAAIEANEPVASLFVPSIPDVSVLAQGVDALPWPRRRTVPRDTESIGRRMLPAAARPGQEPP
jgi:hypothetical protein